MNTIMKKLITQQSCNHHLEKINNHNEKKKYLKSKQKMFQTFIYILKIAKFNIKCFKLKYERALKRILGTKTYYSRCQFHCPN